MRSSFLAARGGVRSTPSSLTTSSSTALSWRGALPAAAPDAGASGAARQAPGGYFLTLVLSWTRLSPISGSAWSAVIDAVFVSRQSNSAPETAAISRPRARKLEPHHVAIGVEDRAAHALVEALEDATTAEGRGLRALGLVLEPAARRRLRCWKRDGHCLSLPLLVLLVHASTRCKRGLAVRLQLACSGFQPVSHARPSAFCASACASEPRDPTYDAAEALKSGKPLRLALYVCGLARARRRVIGHPQTACSAWRHAQRRFAAARCCRAGMFGACVLPESLACSLFAGYVREPTSSLP